MPLTPNGKLDRRALPAPETSGREAGASFIAPRTLTEELLAALWTELLGVEQISRDDSFFDLGGHSLLVTQLISRIRAAFAVEVPVRWVFDAPTVAGLSAHIDAARREDQALRVPPLTPVPRTGDLPLSFAQQRLWFLDQLEGGSATYTIPAALRLSGPLHVAALVASLSALVQRHEALRTTFPAVQGIPVQVIAPHAVVSLAVVDLQTVPAEAQALEVQRLGTAEAQCPFDLARDMLLRATLLRLGADDHVLLVTIHHIVADGWSMGILIHEVATLYRAFVAGQSSPLPPLPIQHADFAHWQCAWLQGDELARQLTYWQEQLAGAPAVLALPTDRPRPAVQTFRGGIEYFQLSVALTQQLQALGRACEATLYMTLLGAYGTLLARYSGQEDMIIGSPIANRTRQELEGLIGFFVNTLLVRLDLTGDPTFTELLARARQITLAAYAHQDLPFEKLVEELQPVRSLSHTPLFQVAFVLQNAPIEQLELPGLSLAPMAIETGTSKFDMTLMMQETAQGLHGAWEYNSDIFEAVTIRRMISQFQTFLAGVVAQPQQQVATIPLLTDAERHQLLVQRHDTQATYPQAPYLHQWFEVQVARTPEALAVQCDDQQLTYGALNHRANQLAHYLQSLGVSPGVLVGLCVERSLELVVGLLGILKAGGAYVPLDPTYPAERLAFMLADAQVRVVVTQATWTDGLPAAAVPVVCVDTDWGAIAPQPTMNPNSGVTPAHPAYVIYTSGSTGQPKGVLVSHAQVIRLFTATQAWLRADARDVWSLFHSYAFDFSVWDF